MFTIVGFFGLKNLNTLKKEYITELGELKKLRTEFENDGKYIKKESEKLQKKLTDILNENREQNKKD